MNKENELKNIESWCKSYQDKTGLKIYPSNPPTDLILDSMLGRISNILNILQQIIEMERINDELIKLLDKRLDVLEDMIDLKNKEELTHE